jgi:hypothetical protein
VFRGQCAFGIGAPSRACVVGVAPHRQRVLQPDEGAEGEPADTGLVEIAFDQRPYEDGHVISARRRFRRRAPDSLLTSVLGLEATAKRMCNRMALPRLIELARRQKKLSPKSGRVVHGVCGELLICAENQQFATRGEEGIRVRRPRAR